MKNKITLLIIASIIGLLSLSLIQAYLVKNTYQLKKDAFLTSTRKAISRIDDYSVPLDSINDIWQERFIEILVEYKRGDITKPEVVYQLEHLGDSINDDFNNIYNVELKKRELENGINYQKRIVLINLLDSASNDTIYGYAHQPKMILLGDDFELDQAHKASNSLWMTEHDYTHEKDGIVQQLSFDLEFLTRDYMNIDQWEKIVFNQMRGILLLSVFIFLFVFGSLYYSIKNLIKQKKVSDIKTDFINNITHELKTPLATLTLATKMLKNESVKSNLSIQESTVNTIERQNHRLQNLIDQVLNNSLGYQAIQLNKESINPEALLNTTLDDFLLSITDKRITITRNFDVMKETLMVDKFYFTTAIINLLENAVKYNDKDEIKVVINASQNQSFELSISDNGMGIPAKDQVHLFDKFYRVGNTDIHEVKGLGLGLYYTHQIVKAHAGSITVNSKENEGTTFNISLPSN